jgi:hypothetical protein
LLINTRFLYISIKITDMRPGKGTKIRTDNKSKVKAAIESGKTVPQDKTKVITKIKVTKKY